MPFRDRLEREFGERVSVCASADGERMDLAAVLAGAPADALVYLCGPDLLITGVMAAARAVGLPTERIHLERFS